MDTEDKKLKPSVNTTEAHLMDIGWMVREDSRSQFTAEADSLPEDGHLSLVVYPEGPIVYFDHATRFTQDSPEHDPLSPAEFAKASELAHPIVKSPETGKRRPYLVLLTDSKDGTPITDPSPFSEYHGLDTDPEEAQNGNPGHYVLAITPSQAKEINGTVTNDDYEISCDVLL